MCVRQRSELNRTGMMCVRQRSELNRMVWCVLDREVSWIDWYDVC